VRCGADVATPEGVTRMSDRILECARAEALFVSTVQRSDPYSAAAVHEAIRRNVRRHGTRGCAALVAHEYGEHPEVAAGRMSWALATVRGAFAGRIRPRASHRAERRPATSGRMTGCASLTSPPPRPR
jgi:hypothetical protein